MKFLWNEFKYPHFKSCITNDDIALLVVASCEPHALHLPVGTDKIIGKYISKRVAEKSKKNIYILPYLKYGFSAHHMSFKGTITLRQLTFISIVEDIIDCVIKAGLRNIIILNSHGCNNASSQVA